MIERVKEEQRREEMFKKREEEKEFYVMGFKKKLAKGPNPLSVKKKLQKVADFPGKIAKKRRFRKGKRSRELSQLKKQQSIDN